jgi:serine/threonine protein kinase
MPFLEGFHAEAQVLAQLQHPGIVPLHDFGRLDNGRPWVSALRTPRPPGRRATSIVRVFESNRT